MPLRRLGISLTALAVAALLSGLMPASSTSTVRAEPAANRLEQAATLVLTKTVGLDPDVCATTDAITVASNAEVTYCYQMTNLGPITLSLHDLVDSHLGEIVSELPYELAPQASLSVRQSAVITETTANTAVWTAYNAGPSDVATAEDTATVTVTAAEPTRYLPIITRP